MFTGNATVFLVVVMDRRTRPRNDTILMNTDSSLHLVSTNPNDVQSYKLEYVILSILLQYEGSFRGSLMDWYLALKPGLPQLSDPQQLRGAFQRLSEDGIIRCEPQNPELPVDTIFCAALHPTGVDQWKTSHTQARLTLNHRARLANRSSF